MMADDDPDRLYPWKRWHTWVPKEEPMAEDRARSFIERYIVARASHFTVGREQEDAWSAALDGKAIYRNIAEVAKSAEPDTQQAQQQGSAAGQMAVPSQGPANPVLMQRVMPPMAQGGFVAAPQSPSSWAQRVVGRLKGAI